MRAALLNNGRKKLNKKPCYWLNTYIQNAESGFFIGVLKNGNKLQRKKIRKNTANQNQKKSKEQY